MKIYFTLLSLIISFNLYGKNLKPCEVIGLERVSQHAILPEDYYGISHADREKITEILKKCISNYEVCIVGQSPQKNNWLNKVLNEPVKDAFDPAKDSLIYGMLQYFDKQKGELICIVAHNNFARAVPWYGRSWVISAHDVREYEIYDAQFNLMMTPHSLYRELLSAHKEAINDAKLAQATINKKIDLAQKMIEEGSDPTFVSKITDLSPEIIKQFHRDK